MNKFKYKKLEDSLVFCYSEFDGWQMTVRTICTHPHYKFSNLIDFSAVYFAYPVGMFVRSYIAAVCDEMVDATTTATLYYDGRLYTFHIDRYKHLVFRIYRVVR